MAECVFVYLVFFQCSRVNLRVFCSSHHFFFNISLFRIFPPIFLICIARQVPVVGLPGQILPTFVRAGLIVYDLASNTARRVLDGKSIVQV